MGDGYGWFNSISMEDSECNLALQGSPASSELRKTVSYFSDFRVTRDCPRGTQYTVIDC